MSLIDFYPTPENLISKMVEDIDFKTIKSILEPSAGKGDILKYISRNHGKNGHAIEINSDLQKIIKSDFKLVGDDFLNFNSIHKYDLIIMNPPFSEGDKHLTKALDIQKDGGSIVCILNAETIRNPYSNLRKALKTQLTELNADIEFLQDEFISAERKTGVEIALIKVSIPYKSHRSLILQNLKKNGALPETVYEPKAIVTALPLENLVEHYQMEIKAGFALIDEYGKLSQYLSRSFEGSNSGPILELLFRDRDRGSYDKIQKSEFIEVMNSKYWNLLFNKPEFRHRLTSNLQNQLGRQLTEFATYEFSIFNVKSLLLELSQNTISSIKTTILNMFDKLTSHGFEKQNHYEDNIHYFNGWATNSAYKVKDKIIMPWSAYDSWNDFLAYSSTRVRDNINDLEKCFDFLDGQRTKFELGAYDVLDKAKSANQTKLIKFKYFEVTFYKKGTTHIKFTSPEILKKFNLYGAQNKGWLPPGYGKKAYNDLPENERAIVDGFEGKDSYAEVMVEREFYLSDDSKLLMLG